MSYLGIAAFLIVAWGVITLVRRVAEREQDEVARGRTWTGRVREVEDVGDDDGIDREELERAEGEVRDLDVNTRPEDGFEGDDWGPGAPRPPRY